jgi:hypothetical protein
MRLHRLVPLAVVAAAGCAALSETPTEPTAAPGALRAFREIAPPPPPPPLDTQAVTLDAGYGESVFSPGARYFANTTGTNVWLAFSSARGVIATPNARLRFNPATGVTKGIGQLIFPSGVILNLSQVTLSFDESYQAFGACDPKANRGLCGRVQFKVDGTAGFFALYLRESKDPIEYSKPTSDAGPG